MIRKIWALSLILISTFTSAAESDLYDFSWLDQDKEVYVLQNRKFRKNGKVGLTAGFGKTISGAFVDATSIQARFNYFFTEELGIEGIYAKNSGEENETGASVREAGIIPFRRVVTDYYGAMAVWAPFYSKINTFNKIIYLDFIFGLGAAMVNEENNLQSFRAQLNSIAEESKSHTGAIWNVGAKFYLSQSMNIRFDVTALHYKAEKARKDDLSGTAGETYYSNFDMTLAFGMDF